MNSGILPYLLLRTPTGKRYLPLVGRNHWTIGRGAENNFVIPDRWISRNHAMLQYTETGIFYLIDLGSRNGTFINGRRVNVPVVLKSGDHVTFGQSELRFFFGNTTTEATDLLSAKDTQTSVLHVRRLMSVLVVDIRNFTVLTRKLDEKILSKLIGDWFRQAGQIIRESGSWVDKYIGDAVMSIWFHGEQAIAKDDVLSIFQAVSDLNKMTADLGNHYTLPFPLRIGVGINTGYAMVGNTGTGDRPDYTAIGDTVNAAFRLESCTKQIHRDIALGESTYNYLADLGRAQQRFSQYTVTLKGYETPTLTYASTFEDLDNFLLDKLLWDNNVI
ncbi:adenylate/guanylate cyclase domain-containing protein [Spirulina major CS-329]|uniref:adenylate/guanylate cyclase domain-containing protein n=1 Tax=Spirulina TaxID=1154 RepID=UPI00232D9688|nr:MULTISPECIES: adenylate/guanylate cyclase domain-containing protein [Spirulina]MDB9495414.1 adenylate/guanylate cyclase domain-containing protein [Spirulina subsalsa CS-330]MDB9504062.1 adenylate/guanylate cyclase domain-containing protein [Spirulina major CS-329]